jgi:hypothetical protein
MQLTTMLQKLLPSRKLFLRYDRSVCFFFLIKQKRPDLTTPHYAEVYTEFEP